MKASFRVGLQAVACSLIGAFSGAILGVALGAGPVIALAAVTGGAACTSALGWRRHQQRTDRLGPPAGANRRF